MGGAVSAGAMTSSIRGEPEGPARGGSEVLVLAAGGALGFVRFPNVREGVFMPRRWHAAVPMGFPELVELSEKHLSLVERWTLPHAPVEGVARDFVRARLNRSGAIENVRPRIGGPPFVGIGQDRGKPRRLHRAEARGGLAEIVLGCGFCAEIAMTPIDEIEIGREDSLLRPERFNEHGQICLGAFAYPTSDRQEE